MLNHWLWFLKTFELSTRAGWEMPRIECLSGGPTPKAALNAQESVLRASARRERRQSQFDGRVILRALRCRADATSCREYVSKQCRERRSPVFRTDLVNDY
jgi:hypothetical protein